MDTLNYFKMPLVEIGQKVGVPKMTMPDWDAPEDAWSEYCRNDVLITLEAIKMFIRGWKAQKAGNLGRTIASCALNLYRHKHMRRKILIHRLPQLTTLEEQSYFGGRVLVLRRGKFRGKFYKLDVNSMYPYVMREGLYPYRYVDYVEDEAGNIKLTEDMAGRCIADVELRAKLPFYPV
ncbi:MAG: hypothetical protein C4291_15760, partial [Candidatus Dadabacteria bacterium]